jgi:hypothetical protein
METNYIIILSRKHGWIAKGMIVAVGHPQPTSELVKFQASTKSRVSSTKRLVLVGTGMGMTCVGVEV